MSQEKTADECMNSMFFFDDWMLQAREGLDRIQGRPVLLAEIRPELPEHLSRSGGDGRHLDVL